MEMRKVAVLVGESMNFDIMGCEVELALNTKELLIKVENNNIDDIIIESFEDKEYEAIKGVIESFKRDGKNVYFYIPNNEDEICGLADEMDMEIYMYIEDIVRAMGLE